MAVVYQHIRKDKNEIFYIGIGKTLRRPYRKDRRNDIWNKITSKTDYDVEILHNNITWDEALEIEKQLIKKYGRINLGTGILANMTDGGEGGDNCVYDEKYRESARQRMLNKKFSTQHCEAISKGQLRIGNKPPSAKGRTLKQYHIDILVKCSSSPVIQMDYNFNFIKQWDSIHQAQKELKCNNISAVCRGIRNLAGGFRWKYI